MPLATSSRPSTIPPAATDISVHGVCCSQIRNPKSKIRNLATRFLWSLPLLLAGFCFWKALSPTEHSASPVVQASVSAPAAQAEASIQRRELATRSIEEIRPGMRVLAENPELAGQEIPQPDITAENSRLVTLHMVKSDGHELTIETLQPLEALVVTAL